MNLPDSLYLALIVVGVAVFLVTLGAVYSSGFVLESDTNNLRIGLDGHRYRVSPAQLDTLCLGVDCIPSLTDPSYETAAAADAWLDGGDGVIGVMYQGEAYAFPVQVMRYHHVVNTRLNGDPVAVTYSPHSGLYEVFSRTVDGQEHRFRVSGKLFNGNLVMEDADGTLWSQYLRSAVSGRDIRVTLDTVPAHLVRWRLWQKHHQDTAVLSRNTGIYNVSRYQDDAYYTYRTSTAVPTDSFNDDTLYPKDPVHGVTMNGEAAAYRDVHIRDLELIQDEVGGVPIALVQDEATGLIHVLDRRIEGGTVDLTLRADKLVGDGWAWTRDGVPVNATTRLEPVDARRMYWFAWKLFNPDTRLYTP